jgi:hypothetical protein
MLLGCQWSDRSELTEGIWKSILEQTGNVGVLQTRLHVRNNFLWHELSGGIEANVYPSYLDRRAVESTARGFRAHVRQA